MARLLLDGSWLGVMNVGSGFWGVHDVSGVQRQGGQL